MAVTVLCVGKLRERFYADAAQEYLKRLSRLMRTEVVELSPDEIRAMESQRGEGELGSSGK